MNERFIEIAQQASADLDPEEFMGASEVFLEKYAELIVRECIDCLNPFSRNHSMVGAAQDTIKEHFGVEE